jgi:cell division protease FtsH
MVCSWGMSDKLGMVEYGESDGPVFLARDMGRTRNYSEVTAQTIDAEIKRIIDEAYERATRLLTENRAKVEAIAKALLEFETLEGDHIREIMETGELKNPPKISQPPDLPPPDGEPARPSDSRRNPDENNGELPPAYAGAPA